MVIETTDAEWRENLTRGPGHMRFGSGAFDAPYDRSSCIAEGDRTNPEELLGAAPAEFFSMALAPQLTVGGVTVKSIHTTAKVHFEERAGGWSIDGIDVDKEASIADVVAAPFEEHAQNAKKHYLISRALSGVDVRLWSKLQ